MAEKYTPGESTRNLSVKVFSEVGFLEAAQRAWQAGERDKGVEWFLKLLRLRTFRATPGAQKIKILSAFFVDIMAAGQYDFSDAILHALKMEERSLFDAVGAPYTIATEYFRRESAGWGGRNPVRAEVIAALRRIRPNIPLPG